MNRQERELTSEFHLHMNSDNKLTSISPMLNHRIINLSSLFPIRHQNYLVCVFLSTNYDLFYFL